MASQFVFRCKCGEEIRCDSEIRLSFQRALPHVSAVESGRDAQRALSPPPPAPLSPPSLPPPVITSAMEIRRQMAGREDNRQHGSSRSERRQMTTRDDDRQDARHNKMATTVTIRSRSPRRRRDAATASSSWREEPRSLQPLPQPPGSWDAQPPVAQTATNTAEVQRPSFQAQRFALTKVRSMEECREVAVHFGFQKDHQICQMCDSMTNVQWHGMPVVVCRLCLRACSEEAPNIYAGWQRWLTLFNNSWESWKQASGQ